MAQETPGSEHHGDLAAQLTHRVESLVRLIRDRSVRPIMTGVGIASVAIAGLVFAIVVFVLIGTSLLRLFNNAVFGGRVWATYFLFGGMLTVAGLFLVNMSSTTRRRDVGE